MKVAFDKELLITKSCPLVDGRFNDLVFKADFLMLPSNTFGAILGVQWFKTVG